MVGYKRSRTGALPDCSDFLSSKWSGRLSAIFLSIVASLAMVTLILIPLGIEVVLTSTPLAFESEIVVFSQTGVLNVTGFNSVAAGDDSNAFVVGLSVLSFVSLCVLLTLEFMVVIGRLLWKFAPSQLWICSSLCLNFLSLVHMSFATLELVSSGNAGFALFIFWILVGLANFAFLFIGCNQTEPLQTNPPKTKLGKGRVGFSQGIPHFHFSKVLHPNLPAAPVKATGPFFSWLLVKLGCGVLHSSKGKKVLKNKSGTRVCKFDPPMGRAGWGDSLSPGTPPPLDESSRKSFDCSVGLTGNEYSLWTLLTAFLAKVGSGNGVRKPASWTPPQGIKVDRDRVGTGNGPAAVGPGGPTPGDTVPPQVGKGRFPLQRFRKRGSTSLLSREIRFSICQWLGLTSPLTSPPGIHPLGARSGGEGGVLMGDPEPKKSFPWRCSSGMKGGFLRSDDGDFFFTSSK